jgi:hypothetical protein
MLCIEDDDDNEEEELEKPVSFTSKWVCPAAEDGRAAL